MCTVIVFRRPDHEWPVLVAANRDELRSRPWRAPGRHWPDRPEVVAGLDLLAGGTWLGVNDHGVVAAVMNRRGSLGPDDRLRSRGELVLEALDHADAVAAAHALAGLNGLSYRTFNIVVADNRDAYWLRSQGAEADGKIELFDIPAGVSMLTSHDRNDPASPRIRHHLPRFERATAPDPESGDWAEWERLMASREHDPAADGRDAMEIVTSTGFATVSSSLVALPSVGLGERRPLWRFAPGLPGKTAFAPIDLSGA